MKAYIKAITYYLPTQKLTNTVLNNLFPDWSVEKISQKTGIFERRIAKETECSSDLGIESARRLFKENDIKPEEIDFLLFCTQSPDYFLPTTACIIQEKLEIPKTAGALDFNLGCSGYIYGLGLAKGLIETGQANNLLFITGETYSKFIHPKDKSSRTIFGDAGSATLLGVTEKDGSIGPFVFGTDGKGANNLIVKTGGLRYPKTTHTGKDFIDEYGNIRNEDSLYMNGPDIFSFTLKEVPLLINKLYERSGLRQEDIDLFVFHQANKYMLDAVRKKMKIPPEKFYEFLANCGNTVSASIPIALCNAMAEGRIKKGDTAMLAGFGVGYSWGGCIVIL